MESMLSKNKWQTYGGLSIWIASTFLIFWGVPLNSAVKKEKEVMIGISGAYIPTGFDHHSEAYVIVNGVFQNGCYKWSKSEIGHINRTTHEIRSYAYVSQGMCLMVLVPFLEEVRLGQLQSGIHRLKFVGADGTYLEKKLIID